MQSPDTTDPQWTAEREKLWRRYADDLSEELSRKEIAWIRPMFFEPEFDYGNAKYGELKHNHRLAIRLCPIQTQERWRRYLIEDAPRWVGKEYKLAEEMRDMASFDDDLLSGFTGMDVTTQVELVQYLFGDRFIRGNFEFEGVTASYPVTANYVHDSFIRHADSWLSGCNPAEDIKWHHFVEYWRSALPYVNGVYFKYKRSRSGGVSAAQGCLQRVLMSIRDYDIEEVKQYQSNRGEDSVIVQDKGLRQQTADALKDMLDHDQSLPTGLRDLWEMAQSAEFSPSPRGDEQHCLDSSEDVPQGFTYFDH